MSQCEFSFFLFRSSVCLFDGEPLMFFSIWMNDFFPIQNGLFIDKNLKNHSFFGNLRLSGRKKYEEMLKCWIYEAAKWNTQRNVSFDGEQMTNWFQF